MKSSDKMTLFQATKYEDIYKDAIAAFKDFLENDINNDINYILYYLRMFKEKEAACVNGVLDQNDFPLVATHAADILVYDVDYRVMMFDIGRGPYTFYFDTKNPAYSGFQLGLEIMSSNKEKGIEYLLNWYKHYAYLRWEEFYFAIKQKEDEEYFDSLMEELA